MSGRGRGRGEGQAAIVRPAAGAGWGGASPSVGVSQTRAGRGDRVVAEWPGAGPAACVETTPAQRAGSFLFRRRADAHGLAGQSRGDGPGANLAAPEPSLKHTRTRPSRAGRRAACHGAGL